MGKTSKKRKLNAQLNKQGNKTQYDTGPAPLSPDESGTEEPKNLRTLITEEEMEITVDTLLTLAEHQSIIKSKPCRDLRAAVYTFRQACTTGVNMSADTSFTARVSAALVDGKYTDALITLAEMRIRNERPKLGALCRWVRDLDVVSGVYVQTDIKNSNRASRTKEELERIRVLDSILRVLGPLDTPSQGSPMPSSEQVIVQQDIWNLQDNGSARLRVRASVLDGSIFTTEQSIYQNNFSIIENIPGPQRKPPNHHPAIIHLSNPDTVPLSANPPPITLHKHPHIANLSLLKDVLTPYECQSIIAATESVGFLPDAPINDDGSEGSILAHNVYWMIDQSFHDKLWQRVSPLLPPSISGKTLRSINRRFRVYRYVPGAEYRVHIDGAWPPSGVDPTTKAYQYDSSSASARQSSLFTFLIYLNDEFEGGHTNFFVPSVVEGVMNAYPITPVMGSVAMFPHGEAEGALLHEGSGVRRGAKYIIRTDVVYDVGSTAVGK